MMKRTTIEIDEELLARAKRALGESTARGTVEAALRRAAEQAEAEFQERKERQLQFFATLEQYVDLEVLASDEMWR